MLEQILKAFANQVGNSQTSSETQNNSTGEKAPIDNYFTNNTVIDTKEPEITSPTPVSSEPSDDAWLDAIQHSIDMMNKLEEELNSKVDEVQKSKTNNNSGSIFALLQIEGKSASQDADDLHSILSQKDIDYEAFCEVLMNEDNSSNDVMRIISRYDSMYGSEGSFIDTISRKFQAEEKNAAFEFIADCMDENITLNYSRSGVNQVSNELYNLINSSSVQVQGDDFVQIFLNRASIDTISAVEQSYNAGHPDNNFAQDVKNKYGFETYAILRQNDPQFQKALEVYDILNNTNNPSVMLQTMKNKGYNSVQWADNFIAYQNEFCNGSEDIFTAIYTNFPDKNDNISLMKYVTNQFDDAILITGSDKYTKVLCSQLTNCLNGGNCIPKEFAKDILKRLSDESLHTVMLDYDYYTDRELEDDIQSLSKKDRKYAQNRIDKAFLTSRRNHVNGEINDNSQGRIGDCWMLSGLNALSYSPAGREIIKNAIEETKTGYEIELKGADPSIIEIDATELRTAIESGRYAKDDYDVVLFELAYEKAMEGMQGRTTGSAYDNPDGNSPIDGGTLNDFLILLIGKSAKESENALNMNLSKDAFINIITKPSAAIVSAFTYTSYNDILDKIADEDRDIAAQIGFSLNVDGSPRYITDIYGEEHLAARENHAWAIKSADKDTVTIVNPWNSSEEVVISRDEFNKNVYSLEYFEF